MPRFSPAVIGVLALVQRCGSWPSPRSEWLACFWGGRSSIFDGLAAYAGASVSRARQRRFELLRLTARTATLRINGQCAEVGYAGCEYTKLCPAPDAAGKHFPGPGGHYRVTGSINGQMCRFMVRYRPHQCGDERLFRPAAGHSIYGRSVSRVPWPNYLPVVRLAGYRVKVDRRQGRRGSSCANVGRADTEGGFPTEVLSRQQLIVNRVRMIDQNGQSCAGKTRLRTRPQRLGWPNCRTHSKTCFTFAD